MSNTKPLRRAGARTQGPTSCLRYGIVRGAVSTRPSYSPTRRVDLALTLALVLVSGLGACSDGGSGNSQGFDNNGAGPPNICLIISDDQDNAHFGFAGHPLAHSPNIDALAREGCVFTTLHTPPRCRPSLAILLSGRWPHQSGIYANRHRRRLAPEGSLPNRLKRAGYATFGGGKYWEDGAAQMGFDAPVKPDRGFGRVGQEDLFAFMDEHGGKKPLFVWWAPALPHTPHNPPQRCRTLFDSERIEVPDYLPNAAPALFRKYEHLSLAMGAWLDDELGSLLEAFKSRGLYDNTLFLFLIDNGWSNGLAAKGSPFEKGIRTPLVALWPGQTTTGKQLDALVESVDIYPTLLEAAGIDVPRDLPGQSFLKGLRGEPFQGREVLYGAIYGRAATGEERPEQDAYALYARDARWKYIYYLNPVDEQVWDIMQITPQRDMTRSVGDEDLFDLAKDPNELVDLAEAVAQRERMDRMRAGAFEWWSESGGKKLR